MTEATPPSAPGMRIVVCDDRRLLREALARYLAGQPGIDAVEETDEGEGAVRAIRDGAEFLLIGTRHSGSTALEVLDRLTELRMTVPVLLIGVPDTVGEIVRAVVAGPVSICRGDVPPRALFEAVVRTAAGDVVLPEDLIAPVLQRVSAQRRREVENLRLLSSLTAREREVLELLCEGVRRSTIAQKLALSPHTVRTHIAHVMQKLDAHTQLEAAMRARELLRMN